MKVLLLDNFDSFVYNIAQYLGQLGCKVEVLRNDVGWREVEAARADAIVISPGPGRPADAGCSIDVIRELGTAVPILGVCLGHQAIGEAFGGEVVRAATVMHGKTSLIHHEGDGLFKGIPQPFEATRYHSLIVKSEGLPEQITVTARTDDGVIMALRHRDLDIFGVQFHPESILTRPGLSLLRNFLALAGMPAS